MSRRSPFAELKLGDLLVHHDGTLLLVLVEEELRTKGSLFTASSSMKTAQVLVLDGGTSGWYKAGRLMRVSKHWIDTNTARVK